MADQNAPTEQQLAEALTGAAPILLTQEPGAAAQPAPSPTTRGRCTAAPPGCTTAAATGP